MRQVPTHAAAGLAGALLIAALARPAASDTPSTLASSLFAFPGATGHPASAVSAGLAMADRWLGDDPFDNPAAAPGPGVALSGALLHVSRQDLRALNRNFDETPAFFDGAGLVGGLPARGRYGFALYAFQPVLQQESYAFSRGTGTPDPMNPPAAITAEASARELRAGLAVSAAVGPGRIGAALEWNRRDDRYEIVERSGSPDAGARRLDITGDAVGFQIGARMDHGDPSSGGLRVGVGIRRHPALAVDASVAEALLIGTIDSTLSAEREAGWELGASARYAASPALRVLASLGGRGARAWQGFELAAGRAWEWKLALEFHDARDPWTLRFGLGQERESGVPEPRADVLGLGFGWQFTRASIDAGVVHRTLARTSTPNSFEDRVVLTVRTSL